MKIRFLPDEPISTSLQDSLGFGDFVRLIQDSIHCTEPPFVYGILGDWGSGKTSILRLLQAQLDKDYITHAHPLVPIWFNAWAYENEIHIVYPLLYTIKQDYLRRFSLSGTKEAFTNNLKQVVATSFLALTDVTLRVATKQLTGEALKLKDLSEQLQSVKDHPDSLEHVLSTWADQVTELRNAFENLLQVFAADVATSLTNVKSENVRFVILIDDLDRCLPETTIAILESIKNHLSVKNCIFVLGLNPQVVYQGIRLKYRGLDINGREYLEKILNYSFYVPGAEPQRVASFCTSQLQKHMGDTAIQDQYSEYFRQFGQILEGCNFRNPRKIKRILNHYLFFLNKYESMLKLYRNSIIVRLIILAEYFPDIFSLFVRDASATRSALEKVGTSLFDIPKFEHQFGVSLNETYTQMSNVRPLFELILPDDHTQVNLDQHVQAVFDIVHIAH